MANPKKLTKLRAYVNLIDSIALGIYISLSILFQTWMMAIGKYSLMLFPLFDGLRLFTKIYNFHLKYTDNQLQNKDYISLFIYITKFILASVGIGLVLGAGMPVLGFTLAIIGIYLVTLTALYKTIRDIVNLANATAETSPNLITKIANNALNTLTVAIIGTSFVILTYFPVAALLAYGMLLVASSLSVVRILPIFLVPSRSNTVIEQNEDLTAITHKQTTGTDTVPENPHADAACAALSTDSQTSASKSFFGFSFSNPRPVNQAATSGIPQSISVVRRASI